MNVEIPDKDNSALVGWICPKCGRGLAPWVSQCPCYYQDLPITCSTNTVSTGQFTFVEDLMKGAKKQTETNRTVDICPPGTTVTTSGQTIVDTTGPCRHVCGNKTNLGYCKSSACIHPVYGYTKPYGRRSDDGDGSSG